MKMNIGAYHTTKELEFISLTRRLLLLCMQELECLMKTSQAYKDLWMTFLF